MSPIQRGLKDRHPYVRRTAVMGVLKVYNFDADAVRNCGASDANSAPTAVVLPPRHVSSAAFDVRVRVITAAEDTWRQCGVCVRQGCWRRCARC